MQAKQTLIIDFISSVEKYMSQRDEQPEISMFNFWSWSKQMKKASVNALLDVLQSLKEGKDITLDQKQKLEECSSCITNGELGKTVQEHLLKLGLNKVTDLVAPAVKVIEKLEKVEVVEDDLFAVDLIDGNDLVTNVVVGLINKDEPKHITLQKQIKMEINENRVEEDIRRDLKVQ